MKYSLAEIFPCTTANFNTCRCDLCQLGQLPNLADQGIGLAVIVLPRKIIDPTETGDSGLDTGWIELKKRYKISAFFHGQIFMFLNIHARFAIVFVWQSLEGRQAWQERRCGRLRRGYGGLPDRTLQLGKTRSRQKALARTGKLGKTWCNLFVFCNNEG